jgi:hypothetical protein
VGTPSCLYYRTMTIISMIVHAHGNPLGDPLNIRPHTGNKYKQERIIMRSWYKQSHLAYDLLQLLNLPRS